MLGTLINAVTVAIGSSAGLLLKGRLPESVSRIIFHVLGVFTLILGFQETAKSDDLLLMMLSVVVGSIVGQLAQLEERLGRFADRFNPEKENAGFTKGLMTAFMLFCVGTLTVLGCFEEGTTGNRRLIVTKSVMDLFSSAALATVFGRGVLLSIVPLVLYQGGLTLGAGWMSEIMTAEMMNEMAAAGGLMLIALGINILEIKEIRVVNMLPGLIIVVFATYLAQRFNFYSVL